MMIIIRPPTPGPWTLLAGSRSWVSTLRDAYGKGPMHVADIRGWGFLTGRGAGGCGMTEEEALAIQAANARLIVSAPQLLALVLEGVPDCHHVSEGPWPGCPGCRRDALVGYIERAEGPGG